MGPEATAELYLRIIRIFQSMGVKYDSDYPKIFIYNLPLPDIVKKRIDENAIIYSLINGVKTLENAGSSFIAISCNSVYYYLKKLQKSSSIPIIDLIGETCALISKKQYKLVGILGTNLTIKRKLFEKCLDRYGIKTLIPTAIEQKIITKVIMNILSGKKLESDKMKLLSIIKSLKGRGGECVILGCTELPLILSNEDGNLVLIDTLDILAKTIVKNSAEERLGVN